MPSPWRLALDTELYRTIIEFEGPVARCDGTHKVMHGVQPDTGCGSGLVIHGIRVAQRGGLRWPLLSRHPATRLLHQALQLGRCARACLSIASDDAAHFGGTRATANDKGSVWMRARARLACHM